MNKLTFNPSDWGNIDEVTATVTSLGHGDNVIKFRGEQFEASQYISHGYKVADLSFEGNVVATAMEDKGYWYAMETGGDLSREDANPLVALLQVACNIF